MERMLDTLKTFHSFGLHDGEVFYSRDSTTVYEYAAGVLKVKNSGTDEGFGIRVLKDKKLGFAYSSSKAKVGQAVEKAISLSKFSQPTSFSFAGKQKYKSAEAYDRKVSELDELELRDIVYSIASGVKNSKGSEPVRIVVVSQNGESAIANTNLLFAKERTSSFMAFVEAKNTAGFGSSQYSHYKILKNPEKLGEQAGRMAGEMRNPKKLPGGKYSVIFSPDTLSSLLELLTFSFSGDLKRRKISKLHDKEGSRLFDEKLTVYDDPFSEAISKSAFDGEGVSSSRMPLIEKGAVRNFYYSRESAALAGVKKEGNCSRGGYDAPPRLGGSNLVIAKGDSKPEEELRKYVYIDSMHGLHTANSVSGDFGSEVSIAFLHEGGKKTPVRGFMVSENIFNLFGKIECLGAEQIQSGDLISPLVAFRDVSLIS